MYFNELEPATEGMWELFDAPYEGTGMNSRNHHMFSSVSAYLVQVGQSYAGEGKGGVCLSSFSSCFVQVLL